MSDFETFVAYNLNTPLNEGESASPDQDGYFHYHLACFDGNELRKCVEVKTETIGNFKFGELLLVYQTSDDELTNGSIVTLDDSKDIQAMLKMEQCTKEEVGSRVVYTLYHVDVHAKDLVGLGLYHNQAVGTMEDPKRLIAPSCYHSIMYQLVLCDDDDSFKLIILSANEEETDETELATKVVNSRFERMPEVIEAENDHQIKAATAIWKQVGRLVLVGLDKSNAMTGTRPILSITDDSQMAAFENIQEQSKLNFMKLKQDENGEWVDDEHPTQTGTVIMKDEMKCKIKLKPGFERDFERLFKIGDIFRAEAELSKDQVAFWRKAIQQKSDLFQHTVVPNPNATEEERFQGVLEEKAMEKEALDRLRDRTTAQNNLNPIQHKAVMMALNDERKLVCIQGPPGTGKSHTLSVIISKFIMKKRGEVVRRKAIVLTPTREACRNIMEMTKSMAEKMEVTDLHEHTFMDAATFNKILEECPEQKRIAEYFAQWEKDFADGKITYDQLQNAKKSETSYVMKAKTREIMTHVRVIFSTIASSFVDTATRTKGFENALCIIDEAGQVKESETWPAVMKMSRIVMAGDPSQLPAVVMSEEAREFRLDDSLMKRIEEKKDKYSWIMLENQYRSHKDITEWSSNTFYGKSIVNNGPVATILENLAVQPDNSVVPLFSPFVLVDTSYESQKPLNMKTFENGVAIAQATQAGSDLSYANLREGEIVVEHFLNLRRRGIKVQDVAIITPYTAQKELVQGLIKEQIRKEIEEGREDVLEFEKVKIGTVDSYQGQEFLAVIFSMVRSNPKFHLGFVEDLRRLNVAITRAKKHFMLVGNGIMLQKSRTTEIKNLFDIFVRDRHRFPPSFVFGNATPYGLTSTKTNFGLNLVDFLAHCKGKDEKMARHCEMFAKNREEYRARERIARQPRAD